jgi:hypothetical protein
MRIRFDSTRLQWIVVNPRDSWTDEDYVPSNRSCGGRSITSSWNLPPKYRSLSHRCGHAEAVTRKQFGPLAHEAAFRCVLEAVFWRFDNFE